ncbi:hypothetical protein H1R20_g15213, partial [Candolleomyces eurysporus]
MVSDPSDYGSDSDSSIGFLDDDGDDEHLLPKVVPLQDSKERRLEEVFTPNQLRYLESLKVDYVELRRDQRPEFALKIAGRFIKHMQRHGLAKTDQAQGQVRAKVRTWFQQHCRPKKDLPRWARAWTGRWVYYHENPDAVRQAWIDIRRAKGEDIPDIPPDEDYISADDEDDNAVDESGFEHENGKGGVQAVGGKKDDGPVRPPVGYFQQALSQTWKQLPRSIRMDYERKALESRLDGPTQEMQQTLAEKKLPRIASHFAETIFKQMGVRVMMLVTYTDPDHSTVCSMIDYNGRASFGRKPFLDSFRKEVADSGIMALWGAYAKETGVTKEETKVDPGLIRRVGKPLLPLELNRYGEPRIPNPSTIPDGEQANQYLPQVIRNIVIYNYARSSGRAPNRTVPPWSDIVANIRCFVSEEYLPDHLATNFKEPSAIKVGPAREILLFWRARQKAKKIPLIIHSYIDDSGQLVPREPREPLLGHEELASDYRDSDEGIPHVPPKKRQRKKKIVLGDNDRLEAGSLAIGKGDTSESNPLAKGSSGVRAPVGSIHSGAALPDIDLALRGLGDPVPDETQPRSQRRPAKQSVRRVVDSDSQLEDQKPIPLDSPFASPPPDTVALSTPTEASRRPSACQTRSTTPATNASLIPRVAPGYLDSLEADLVGLSDEVKRLVLDTVQRNQGGGRETMVTTIVGADRARGSDPSIIIKQSDSPLQVNGPTDPPLIDPSESPIPEEYANGKGQKKGKARAVPITDESGKRPPVRRRRKEEEILAEMAESAGAKSGPRNRSKKATRLS